MIVHNGSLISAERVFNERTLKNYLQILGEQVIPLILFPVIIWLHFHKR